MNDANARKAAAPALLTFVVDPPSMLIAGAAFAAIAEKWVRPKVLPGSWLHRNAVLAPCVAIQLVFWTLGPLMYYDVGVFGGPGLGNDFMWNGYLLGHKVVADIPTYGKTFYDVIAYVSWAIQPLCLWLGVKLGYRLVGKTPQNQQNRPSPDVPLTKQPV